MKTIYTPFGSIVANHIEIISNISDYPTLGYYEFSIIFTSGTERFIRDESKDALKELRDDILTELYKLK